jgi:hypothetical protein
MVPLGKSRSELKSLTFQFAIVWGELVDDRAKLLVVVAYPFSMLLYFHFLDRARTFFTH